ncbi:MULTISPECIES: metallophosphoesterase [unclassified Glutamicibacter]|uniref:metallophosphoesterase family protein n=1 Tax=Micrococcales TaxID=85006 RepID=UPI002FCBF103
MEPLTIIQLSDTHLRPEGQLLHGSIDSWQRTEQALEAAACLDPDAIVVTGDIADRGSDIHERAAGIFNQAQRELDCPVITVPGNHDPLGAIGESFNTRRLSTGPHPADTVHEVLGLRIIGLDSGGFQLARGRLEQRQLDWLASLLAVPAPRGSLLLLHHPPVEAANEARAGRGLENPMELAAIAAGSDIRAILCGHYHQASTSQLLSTPVFMAPAVSYNMNPFAPTQIVDEPAAGFNVIKVGAKSVDAFAASSGQYAALHASTPLPAPVKSSQTGN